MLQKSGRLVLWEAMFILELHSAETQVFLYISSDIKYRISDEGACTQSQIIGILWTKRSSMK